MAIKISLLPKGTIKHSTVLPEEHEGKVERCVREIN